MNKKLSILLLFLLTPGLIGCGIQAIPKSNNEIEASWAEVLNQYQRRSDLIPNLVNTVKGYAEHEKSTLESVTQARANATNMTITADKLTPENLRNFQAAQGAVSSALSRLLAVAENYPNLKANENFRDLQVQLEGTENRIAIARRRYIESVQQFNNYVTVFPTNLTNKLFFHYDKKPQLTIENEADKAKAPQIQFGTPKS